MSNRPDFLRVPTLSNKAAIVLLMTTSLLAFAVTPHNSMVKFTAPKSYPVGLNPTAVAIADLNADGKLDLVVANQSGTLSVLFGNGDGSFQPANTFAAGTRLTSVIAADLNGDTKPDLVIVDITSGFALGGQIGILLNNGDGTFGTVRLLPGISNGSSFATGDVNGDLKTDIIVAEIGAPLVHVFIGNGDGTFGSPLDFAPQHVPSSIHLADFNNDGRPDLVLIDNFMHLWLGNGDGTFQLPAPITGIECAGNIILTGDLNQDGNIDIVDYCVNVLGPPPLTSILTFFGNGDGTFRSSGLNDYADQALSLLADVDGDQVPDVLAVDSGGVFVWLNYGDGTFQAPLAVVAGSVNAPQAASDLNGDGARDLVALNFVENSVSVLLNAGTQFSLSNLTLSPSFITRGQTASGAVSVNLLNSFVQPISLSCQVLSSGQSQVSLPSCSVEPNSLTPAANASAMAKLTVNTNTSLAALSIQLNRVLLWLAVTCFGFVTLPGNNSAKRRLAILVVIAGALALHVACASGSSASPTPSTYIVTVTASAGSTQQTTSTSLTVQ